MLKVVQWLEVPHIQKLTSLVFVLYPTFVTASLARYRRNFAEVD
jgi:hypothetical protein